MALFPFLFFAWITDHGSHLPSISVIFSCTVLGKTKEGGGRQAAVASSPIDEAGSLAFYDLADMGWRLGWLGAFFACTTQGRMVSVWVRRIAFMMVFWFFPPRLSAAAFLLRF